MNYEIKSLILHDSFSPRPNPIFRFTTGGAINCRMASKIMD